MPGVVCGSVEYKGIFCFLICERVIIIGVHVNKKIIKIEKSVFPMQAEKVFPRPFVVDTLKFQTSMPVKL